MDEVNKRTYFGREKELIFWFGNRGREREKRNNSNLLSSIYRVSSIGFRLRVGTKNEGFHQRSKGGDFGISNFYGLRCVLETFSPTTPQEGGVLPTLV